MTEPHHGKCVSGIFLTFSGNCKEALTFYQTCFGGTLRFETFETGLKGYAEKPVVNASLISDTICMYGSDLVHNEGRILGNYMAIFMPCKNVAVRRELIQKLEVNKPVFLSRNYDEKLIEITDRFDVRWVLYF
ncbi:glyoxalase [Pedobacter sp. Du54]|uniref:glyoxalase n=1 Tax=Pedobacter anseongensis TaxID=3133439 RepID=UPI0030B17E18